MADTIRITEMIRLFSISDEELNAYVRATTMANPMLANPHATPEPQPFRTGDPRNRQGHAARRGRNGFGRWQHDTLGYRNRGRHLRTVPDKRICVEWEELERGKASTPRDARGEGLLGNVQTRETRLGTGTRQLLGYRTILPIRVLRFRRLERERRQPSNGGIIEHHCNDEHNNPSSRSCVIFKHSWPHERRGHGNAQPHAPQERQPVNRTAVPQERTPMTRAASVSLERADKGKRGRSVTARRKHSLARNESPSLSPSS